MPFSSTAPFYHTHKHNSIKTVCFALTNTSHTTQCTNDFVNAIINDYFNFFKIRKYYIDEYEQPYYGVLSYLHDIGYTVEYELLQEALYRIPSILQPDLLM